MLFYANYGLLASPRPDRIQAALDVLTEFFDRVGLHTKVKKTIEMVCQPYHIVDEHSDVDYTRHMTGVGPYFWKRHQERVWCLECNMDLEVG